jgi:hypothetical protein
MPYTFVAERVVVQETTAALSHPFVPTATVAAGNLAVLLFGGAGAITLGASDDAGNTWAVAKQQSNGTGVTCGIAWSLLVANITTAKTVTATTSSSQTVAGALWEFTGAPANPADQTAGTTGTGNSMTGGTTATLSQADELVVMVLGWSAAAGAAVTTAPGVGYRQPSANESWHAGGSFNRKVSGEYGNVTATTAVTPGMDTTTVGTPSPAWAGATVTFMAAPTGNRLRRWRV